MTKSSRDEKVNRVATMVAQGGWSSIHTLVEKLSNRQLEDYDWLWNEESEEDEDGN